MKGCVFCWLLLIFFREEKIVQKMEINKNRECDVLHQGYYLHRRIKTCRINQILSVRGGELSFNNRIAILRFREGLKIGVKSELE